MNGSNLRTALLLGGSGLVGGFCLQRLLEDSTYGKVISLVGRELPVSHPKLTQNSIAFEQIKPLELLRYGLFGGLRKYRPIAAATVARAMVTATKSGNTGVRVYEFDEMVLRSRMW